MLIWDRRADFGRQGSIEKTYSALVTLAAARRRQHLLNVKCKHLQEAGASEAELRIIRQRAKMVNQIQWFGFQTSADWPAWLAAAGGIAPHSIGSRYRPPAPEAHAPPVITDAALGIYDADSDGDSSGADPDDVEPDPESASRNFPVQFSHLKNVPPRLKKCSSPALRAFASAAEAYLDVAPSRETPSRAEAFEILQLLGPDLAQPDCVPRKVSPILPMSRMYFHCLEVLRHRSRFDTGCNAADAPQRPGPDDAAGPQPPAPELSSFMRARGHLDPEQPPAEASHGILRKGKRR